MDCPKCGKLMILRAGKNGKFYGCSGFPGCKGTARYTPPQNPKRIVEKTTPRDWSAYQLAIFDAVATTENNLVIEAVAGSGKTTTAVQALNYAVRYPRAAYVAFNRTIAQDFASKLPDSVHASTYHSLGLKSIIAVRGKVKVEESKDFMIFKRLTDLMPDGARVLIEEYRGEVLRLASLVKNTLAEPTFDGVLNLSDNYNIDTGTDETSDFVISTALKVFQESAADESCVNFDDMIWWCATGRVNPMAFDIVVTDEMQDTNAARLEMLMRMLREGGRSIAVGDRRQAIYGWAGAHESAMDAFKEATNARELPLEITYRCPASHVREAQKIVPQIKARPNAPEGLIEDISGRDFEKTVQDGDLVLCRMNAPLVRPAFRMLAAGQKAVIVGRDVASGIISTVNRMATKADNTTSATIMLNEFSDYVAKQTERLERQGKFSKADFLRDQFETTKAIADGCYTVEDVTRKIDGIFSDNKSSGVRYSTIHRAKGTEEKNVFIIAPETLPLPRMMEKGTEQEVRAEWNVKYVGITRAKETMRFVYDRR